MVSYLWMIISNYKSFSNIAKIRMFRKQKFQGTYTYTIELKEIIMRIHIQAHIICKFESNKWKSFVNAETKGTSISFKITKQQPA